ncbi:MAG: hypothetical protein RIM99_11870 [Cyclobacteriaceae bacterium]
MEKLKVALEYERLGEEIKEQIKLVYPDGFRDFLISYPGKEGQRISALRFETDEKIYLIRMTSQQALDIIEADPDYEDGSLIDDIRDDYEEKHSDVNLSDNDNYDG